MCLARSLSLSVVLLADGFDSAGPSSESACMVGRGCVWLRLEHPSLLVSPSLSSALFSFAFTPTRWLSVPSLLLLVAQASLSRSLLYVSVSVLPFDLNKRF